MFRPPFLGNLIISESCLHIFTSLDCEACGHGAKGGSFSTRSLEPWDCETPIVTVGSIGAGTLDFPSGGVEAPVPFDFQVVCSNRISRGSPLTSFSHADVVYPPVTEIKHHNGQFLI